MTPDAEVRTTVTNHGGKSTKLMSIVLNNHPLSRKDNQLLIFHTKYFQTKNAKITGCIHLIVIMNLNEKRLAKLLFGLAAIAAPRGVLMW